MTQETSSEFDLIRAAYAAFNSRDIDAALAQMTADVEWPRAFKGGFVQGKSEIRKYWTQQWSEINPRVEPTAFYKSEDNAHIDVVVHQVVRSLKGEPLADEKVGHRFTIRDGLIHRMDILASPPVTK